MTRRRSGNDSGWFAAFVLLCSVYSISGQQPISQVRLLPPGAVVTTTGTIACDDEFGILRYMQDADAGIALYAGDLSQTSFGDSIVVTGVLSLYRGELQLSPVISFQVISQGKPVVPLVRENFSEISADSFESRKVRITCAGIRSCESFLDPGWYELFDSFGNAARLWIAEGSPLIGFPIQDRPLTIEGIWTQFEDQYQLSGQQITDASEEICHYISAPEVSFSQSAPVLTWNKVPEAQTSVWIGEEDYAINMDIGWWQGFVSVIPDFLEQGRLYKARLTQLDSNGTFYHSVPVYFSPPSITEPIEILFNRSVDESYSDGSTPLATGSSAIETDLIDRIDAVRSSLDVAMYNTGRATIVQALNRAVQRGVAVRFIADDETSNAALDGQLSFPVGYRSGTGIMHNKFLIGDADDPAAAWVWTGSTNLSSNQLSTDPNHAYIIHDQALALNYRREFEELWGRLPDRSDARYGDFKTNNTVHAFLVNDVLIESYFSPSDETNCHLIKALRSADHQVLIGLLLLTREDLVNEIIALHSEGLDIRVILEDEESSTEAVAALRDAGVPLVTHDPSTIFHHKYAIIDEGFVDSDPQVITGSHNWTWSADNINDENTLIIHDQSVTNIFRQEFEARWKELYPTSIQQVANALIRAYPNPAKHFIQLNNASAFNCVAELINVHGQVILEQALGSGEEGQIALSGNILPGLYLLRFISPVHGVTSQSILIE